MGASGRCQTINIHTCELLFYESFLSEIYEIRLVCYLLLWHIETKIIQLTAFNEAA